MRLLSMRLLILILLAVTIGGCGVSEPVSPEKSIVGSWKLMRMAKTPIEFEHLTEPDEITIHTTFKTDKTFEMEIFSTKSPNIKTKISGTYTVEGDVLTTVHSNKSTTQSTLKFEKDFMIATLSSPESAIGYYKRIN